MGPQGRFVLECLQVVAAERARRSACPPLSTAVDRVKAYQQARFEQTYPDLLQHPDYRAACRFFLSELYGPYDFTDRDRQFERVVPALVRLFSSDLVGTVARLAELHALSEQLDTQMGEFVEGRSLDAVVYATAWRHVGRPESRQRQIELTLAIGESLARLTRRPLLRQTLRAMRGPAHAAGLADLQRFLEAGFDAFRSMPDPSSFLQTIATRERAFAERQFAVRA